MVLDGAWKRFACGLLLLSTGHDHGIGGDDGVNGGGDDCDDQIHHHHQKLEKIILDH